jgi:hypothetical protein
MEHLQRFTGANRSCEQGLAKRRARNAHRQPQHVNGSQATSSCGCGKLTDHVGAQQQERELADAAIAWQLQATWNATCVPDMPDMPCKVPFEASFCSLGAAAAAAVATSSGAGAGAGGYSYAAPNCDDGSLEHAGSLDSMTDAELEAMIESELLLAATALPGELPAGAAGYNAGMPAAVLPMQAELAAAPAAESDVSAMQHAAQNARMHSLMGQLAELSATLQQLQQAVGLQPGAESGSVMTGY